MDLMSTISRARKSFVPIVAVAAFAMSAATSHAASKRTIEIGVNITEPGFRFSYIHKANSSQSLHYDSNGNGIINGDDDLFNNTTGAAGADGVQDRAEFYNGSTLLLKLSGSIDVEHTNVNGDTHMTLFGGAPATLNARVMTDGIDYFGPSTPLGYDLDLVITTFDIWDINTASGLLGANGIIVYEIKDGGTSLTSGTFTIINGNFAGAPNNIDDTTGDIRLWSNNWDNTVPGAILPSADRLGLDLGGSGGNLTVVVPTPMGVWAGLGLMGAMGLAQFKRRMLQS